MLIHSVRHLADQARGFTLIEVLIALFVLAVGLLGLALLQTTGLRLNTDSYSRTQSTYAAYDIIDKMRANAGALANYDIETTAAATTAINSYNTCKATAKGGNGSCDCSAKACSPTELATYDLGQWYEQQDRLVPGAKDAVSIPATDNGGRATVNVDLAANNTVTVIMRWVEVEPENQKRVVRNQGWTVAIYP